MSTPTGIEAIVCADIARRQAVGIKKYGQTLADNPAELHDRLLYAYEECLDQACYLKWAMEAIKPTIVKRLPQPGDKYRLSHMVVVVKKVENNRVMYDLDGAERIVPLSEFELIAAKSIANGAVFHPAP